MTTSIATPTTTNTAAGTHLPAVHIGFPPCGTIMHWQIVDGKIHVTLEEPFGIIGMDFFAVVRLAPNGTISEDEDDLLEFYALSVDDDTQHEVDMNTALDFLHSEILPLARRDFPLPRKSKSKRKSKSI
jgi:hypothetical protein